MLWELSGFAGLSFGEKEKDKCDVMTYMLKSLLSLGLGRTGAANIQTRECFEQIVV